RTGSRLTCRRSRRRTKRCWTLNSSSWATATMAETKLKLERGGKEWRRMRQLATRAIPGRHSALYYFNAKILQHEDVVPMTYRAHYAMCMFAEGATGIAEIDECRVKMTLVPR